MGARFSPHTDEFDHDCLNCWLGMVNECEYDWPPWIVGGRKQPLPCGGRDIIILTADEVVALRRARARKDTAKMLAIRVAAEAREGA